MFHYFPFYNISIVILCALMERACCNETDTRNFTLRTSMEQAQPMPLIMHLNQSAAEILIQEVNSKYVSNTSFDDLVNDNDTHQLFLQYRERKRQVRLKVIQHEILLKLGLEIEPNVTANITEQQRQNLVSSYERLREMQERNSTIVDSD